jgi:hypothetical protein
MYCKDMDVALHGAEKPCRTTINKHFELKITKKFKFIHFIAKFGISITKYCLKREFIVVSSSPPPPLNCRLHSATAVGKS